MKRLAAAVVALLLPRLAPADWERSARLELGLGYDSNALRDTSATGDGFVGGLARLSALRQGERSTFSLSLTEGGKLFASVSPANLVASRLEAAWRLALGERLGLQAALLGSDLTESGHLRDQDVGRGALGVDLSLAPVRLELRGGYLVSAPREQSLRPFLAAGPTGSAAATWSSGGGHSITVGYLLWKKDYPRWGAPGRSDRNQTFSADYGWRGDLVATAGYAFSMEDSTLPQGASYRRHRLTGSFATFVGRDWSLAAQAALQLSAYPTGISAAELLLSEGDENQTSVELKLSRALRDDLDLAFKLAWYRSELSSGGPSLAFSRTVLAVSIEWSPE